MAEIEQHNRRWYRLTPDRVVLGLLAAEGFLLLSERFRWFAFNQHKGWTVLIALATVGLTLLLMFLWLAAALLFRCRFQYSLRSLLLAVVAVALAFSCLGVTIQDLHSQGEAAMAIRSVGDTYGQATWLSRLLGDPYLASVTEVQFVTAVSDEWLARIEPLHDLRTLDLGMGRVNIADAGLTDAGLRHLQGLDQLETLYLDGRKITDAGLVYLKPLRQLRELSLEGTGVTDDGLVNLEGLSRLRTLRVARTRVTVGGLSRLSNVLPRCTMYYGRR
jgi:hypothetical protein